MRWKVGENEQNMFKCCFCCHVRTGTIILGLFHLMVHVTVLSVMAVVILHPDLVHEGQIFETPQDTEISDTSIKADFQWAKGKSMTSEDKFVGMLLTMGSFFVTILLIYGAIKGEQGYLMPFFCLQVFDFCISCLTIAGYCSYMPDVKNIIVQSDLPFKDELLKYDGDWLMLLLVLVLVLVLSIKAYFMGIVWSCYKYLTNYNSTGARSVRTYDISAGGDDAKMLLPPNYEDVLHMVDEGPAPPPYSAS